MPVGVGYGVTSGGQEAQAAQQARQSESARETRRQPDRAEERQEVPPPREDGKGERADFRA